MRLLERAKARLFEWLQRACPHDPRYVSADVLEGAAGGMRVAWCRRCGALEVRYAVEAGGTLSWINSYWREPRATWWP